MSDAQELAVRQKQELANKEEKTIPGRHFIPTADIFETDEALTVIMEMPGVEKKNVSIALENDLLQVEGQIDFSNYQGMVIGLRGRFGLVLTSGDILRITSITALHESPNGVILLDVLLDHAGVPDGVDQAWRTKHYLGAPVPGATMCWWQMPLAIARPQEILTGPVT